MKTKIFLAISILFTTSFLTSCFDWFGGVEVVEANYNTVDVTAYDTSGLDANEVVKDSVAANTFGLKINVYDETLRGNTSLNHSTGFSAAYATYLDVNYNDQITSYEILMNDTETGETVDYTQRFTIYDYEEQKSKTLADYFEGKQFYQNVLQLDLSDYTDLPKEASFTVRVRLESGTELSGESWKVRFYDR